MFVLLANNLVDQEIGLKRYYSKLMIKKYGLQVTLEPMFFFGYLFSYLAITPDQ